MPTAVPATVPPSRLCTKLFPPLCLPRRSGEQHPFLFVISMRPVLCLPKHTHKNKKYRAQGTSAFIFF